jgi:protein subunit release factor B
MRSNEDAHFEVEMWVSCLKSRRVLALSKSAIMLLSAVTLSSCELKVLRSVHLRNFSPRSFHQRMTSFLQVFPLSDIQNVRSTSSDAVLIFSRSSGAVSLQLSDFPSTELAVFLTTANVWALRG